MLDEKFCLQNLVNNEDAMKKAILKIVLVIATLLFLSRGSYRIYSLYSSCGQTQALSSRQAQSFFAMANQWKAEVGRPDAVGNTAYTFQRMLVLVEACQKVKYLEHLRFVAPNKIKIIETQTIRDLVKAMIHEKYRFKKYVSQLRAQTKEPVGIKKLRSFLYYLHVIEEGIQDLDYILTNRAINNP